jgi:predicted outer membrane repeat protein
LRHPRQFFKWPGGSGGAIVNDFGGHLTLDHCIVTNNVSDQYAGAIKHTGQSLALNDTYILSNSSESIGGIYSDGNLTIVGGSVLSNTSSSDGGGLYVEAYTTATLVGVDIGANTAITGGGILNYGVLALSDSSVHNNSAQAGGGLYLKKDVGAVTIHNTTFTHNRATQNGGGIYKDHGSIKLNLDHVTLSYNTSGGQGGGIYLYDSYSPIPIDHSTFDDNSADGNGGGLFIDTLSTVYITRTTFYGNYVDTTAGQQGGGIYNSGILYLTNSTLDNNYSTHAGGGLFNANVAFVKLFNTTIAHNTSGTDYGGFGGNDVPGGGFANAGTGVVSVTDSLIADNTRELSDINNTLVPDDCYGKLTSVQGYNLIGTTIGCTITGTLTGVISNTDPQLDVLKSNGGVNQTDALLNGSPAINAGNPNGCLDN